MKSLAELEAIRQRTLEKVAMRKEGDDAVRVVVGMATCGMCRLEPMLDVIMPGKEKVTYVRVNPDMVPRIVAEHIVNGRPVQEYTIGAAEGE